MTPPAPDLAAVIVERSAQALVALHAAGLDHGMVVPELVWISTEGEVRLHGAEAGPTLRRPASGLGDLAPYLAPEVRAGETPSAADEVWSLAAYHTALNNYAGNLEYGYGAAMALALVIIGIVLALLYLRVFNYRALVAKPLIEH